MKFSDNWQLVSNNGGRKVYKNKTNALFCDETGKTYDAEEVLLVDCEIYKRSFYGIVEKRSLTSGCINNWNILKEKKGCYDDEI